MKIRKQAMNELKGEKVQNIEAPYMFKEPAQLEWKHRALMKNSRTI
jgi:hypothetical protein